MSLRIPRDDELKYSIYCSIALNKHKSDSKLDIGGLGIWFETEDSEQSWARQLSKSPLEIADVSFQVLRAAFKATEKVTYVEICTDSRLIVDWMSDHPVESPPDLTGELKALRAQKKLRNIRIKLIRVNKKTGSFTAKGMTNANTLAHEKAFN